MENSNRKSNLAFGNKVGAGPLYSTTTLSCLLKESLYCKKGKKQGGTRPMGWESRMDYHQAVNHRPDSETYPLAKLPEASLELNPFFVTGYSDGEACFHLAIGKNPRYRIGYYVNPGFSIIIHQKDLELLKKIQEFFGAVGIIKPSTRQNMIEFRVFSIKDLDIILNHFDQYPLITKKCADYLLFKEALELIKNKKHLTIEGFNEIIAIRASINKGLPEILKKNFPHIVGKTVPLVTIPDNLNPY
jgi:hypothetical protein